MVGTRSGLASMRWCCETRTSPLHRRNRRDAVRLSVLGCDLGEAVSGSKQVSNTGRPKPPNAGKGRPAGTPNKVTQTVKEALQEAFQKVGGAEYLARLAESEPRAFAALIAKMIPNNVTVEGGLDVRHLFIPDQLRRMADLQEGKE